MMEGLVGRDNTHIPLVGVEVDGEVLGGTARVRVRQKYVNREARPVEAIYVFPLPADATLTAFSMECAGRRVEGVVQEREQAFRTYDDAITAGHGAALLEQERPNVFTANVGNLLPNEETLVEVEYVQRVQVDEGAVRWMIPTLVAPRYVPGAPAMIDRTGHGAADPTTRVPDADRISPPIGDVDYRLKMNLVLWLGDDVEVESPSHQVSVSRAPGKVTVSLSQQDVRLDRDVVLTARGPAAHPIAGLLSHKAGSVGHCSLTVIPDLFDPAESTKSSHDVVFVVDRSGSMGGSSMDEARAAMRLCLRHLREGDRFNIVAFDDSMEWFSGALVPFTQRTLSDADRWMQRVDARGGTELREPLVQAVSQLTEGVVVLLTDGQVANENEILEAVLAVQRKVRVLSFGIGTNVSDALLRELGRRTGGGVEFIHPGERIDEKVVAQFSRATAARVTDVKVKFVGVDVAEIAPAELPSLVDGEAWTIFGTYEKPGVGRAEIRGVRGGEAFYLEVPVELVDGASHPALSKLWAAERIRDLEGAALSGRRADAMKDRIVKLAVEHGVSSKFTSFVVVEKREGDRRASGMPETRVVSVEKPAGWDMFAPAQAASTTTRAGTIKGNAAAVLRRMSVAGPQGGGATPTGAPPAARAMPMAPAPAYAKAKMAREVARDDDDDLKTSVSHVAAPRAMGLRAPEPSNFASFEPEAEALDEASAVFDAPADTVRPAAPDGGGVVGLLSRQLASGLWDDPSASGPESTRQLRATARALIELVREGITTGHAIYGVQVRKAVEAMLPLLDAHVSSAPALVETCIAVAYLASSGRRTRASVEALVDRFGLRDKVRDESALRGRLDQLAAAV